MRFTTGLAIALAAACGSGQETSSAVAGTDLASQGNPTQHRRYGAAVPLGGGSARAYIDSAAGQPAELGIALSEHALEGLPGTGWTSVLPLPANDLVQYQLIELDWNPAGHPPPGIYTVPHFDFHFYVIGLAARDAIDPSDPAFAAKAANFPPAQYWTPGWVPTPGVPADNAVPHMGLHWLNFSSPEWSGHLFTRTFIFGSWDGHFIFDEPMVSLAYLQSRPDDVIALPQAATYEPAGWYPRAYRVAWDGAANEWHVALTQLGAQGFDGHGNP